MELEHEHPLACVGVANHHISQETMLLTQVVEGIIMGVSVFEHEVANLVAEVIHQPALLDRVNLVEGTGDVETDGVLGMALLERSDGIVLLLREGCDFLGGEPTFVGASELYLVAILLGLHAAHDRAELWQLNLADAGELVFHLFLLCLDLLSIRQVLPLATAADAEVLAHRLLSHVALFDEANHLRLAILMFFLDYLQVYHIARHAERHEDDLVVYVSDALALGCYSLDGDVFQQR